MDLEKKNAYGHINISLDAIASVAGDAVTNVFGVVGLGTKKSISDDINVFLNLERYKDGVAVKKGKGSSYSVSLYVILAYGAKITEVIGEIQRQVTYFLQKAFDIKISAVDVYVQGIKRI
ncbi:MAG: Asp23/Gls24 family envelope stress response protein [Bacilli bacterium]|jgi:uncharacterized alkaline shock family protein YloU|nr:Asp23/Gls24 family envelope stress response protein [Bacilli bacterium]